LTLGPISPEKVNIHKIVSDYKTGKLSSDLWDSNWQLADGSKLLWGVSSQPLDSSIDSEKIQIKGIASLETGQIYLLRTTLRNQQEQHVRYICDSKSIRYVFINGKEINRYNGVLPKGGSELVMVYIHQPGNSDGISMRIINAYSGLRVTNIMYEPENSLDLIKQKDSVTRLNLCKQGTVEFIITDKLTGREKSCRLYVYNDKGQPQYDEDCPSCFGHFICQGQTQLRLPEGNYTYQAEVGKEFHTVTGTIHVSNKQTVIKKIELVRFADITSQGWYAGDLHNHTSIDVTQMLMKAENIHITYVPWWWINHSFGKGSEKSLFEYKPLIQFNGNRFLYTRAGEDERRDATLMFFGMPEDMEIGYTSWTYPPPVHFAETFGKIDNVWVHLDHMFWWDTPALLASGELDSIEVLNNNFTREHDNDTEAWGKPRDMQKYPHPSGNAVYQQDVYFHMLNCGFRIPPAAGSAACVGGEPFGYNRVYVKVSGKLTWTKWWENLRAGKCFITNGPLLRVKANGKYPGHVFKAGKNGTIKLKFNIDLDSRDQVSEVQIINNGKIVRSIPYSNWPKNGKIGPIKCAKSGWIVVRALTKDTNTYRFAMTAPYYIEIGDSPKHISKASVEFFLDWARQASELNTEVDPDKKYTFDAYSKKTIKFWEYLSGRANSE